MESYDPLIAPIPAEWLALSEDKRIALVQTYHEQANIEILGLDTHALVHAVVEAQLAEDDDPAVNQCMTRLLARGLNRHEAIHAIGSEFINAVYLSTKRPDETFDTIGRYHGGLKRLKPRDWRGTA